MVLNLPAVILAAFLSIGIGRLYVLTSESWILAFSAVFAPLIWYPVGKWIDDQSTIQNPNQSTHRRIKSALRIVVRVIVWCLFGPYLISSLGQQSEATRFMSAVVALWLGGYLAGGLLGDWRRGARRRKEETAMEPTFWDTLPKPPRA